MKIAIPISVKTGCCKLGIFMHYNSFSRVPIALFPGPTITVWLTASNEKLGVDHHNTVKLPGNIVQGTIIYTVQWIVVSFPGPTIAVRLL